MKKLLYTTMLIASLALAGAANAQVVIIGNPTPIGPAGIPVGPALPDTCLNGLPSLNDQVASQASLMANSIRFMMSSSVATARALANKTVHLGSGLYTSQTVNQITGYYYVLETERVSISAIPNLQTQDLRLQGCTQFTEAAIDTAFANAVNSDVHYGSAPFGVGAWPNIVYP